MLVNVLCGTNDACQWVASIILFAVVLIIFILSGCFVSWLLACRQSQRARNMGWPEDKISECEPVNTSSFSAALLETFLPKAKK